jgi:hypothetical protein
LCGYQFSNWLRSLIGDKKGARGWGLGVGEKEKICAAYESP